MLPDRPGIVTAGREPAPATPRPSQGRTWTSRSRSRPTPHTRGARRPNPSTAGETNINGVIAQKWRGPVGTSGGTGYLKGYGYDSRLQYASPPYVQEITETDYRTSQWAEVTNPSGLPA
jgi:hypothetical protein